MEREDYIIEQNKKKVETQFWIDTYGKIHKYSTQFQISQLHGKFRQIRINSTILLCSANTIVINVLI